MQIAHCYPSSPGLEKVSESQFLTHIPKEHQRRWPETWENTLAHSPEYLFWGRQFWGFSGEYVLDKLLVIRNETRNHGLKESKYKQNTENALIRSLRKNSNQRFKWPFWRYRAISKGSGQTRERFQTWLCLCFCHFTYITFSWQRFNESNVWHTALL